MMSNADEKQDDPPQAAIGNEGGNLQGATMVSTTDELATAALVSTTDEEQAAVPAAKQTETITETQELLNKKELYFCKYPQGGKWIHAQARLHVAVLGPKVEENKKESSEEEKKESLDEDDDDESGGSYESDMGEVENDYEEDPEYCTDDRPILNLEEVERTAELVYDVIDNEPHTDADTVLSDNKPSKEGGKRQGPSWATVGSVNPKRSPRQIAKTFYQHVMKFTPKLENGDPDFADPEFGDGVFCQSYSTNKEQKNKRKCKCIMNTHQMMVNDLRILSDGDMEEDATAVRIHKARWIGFFERIIKKILMSTLYPYEEESLFSFLHVAFPYPNPANKNTSPRIVLEDEESGIKMQCCYYTTVYILGDHFHFERGRKFQREFWSGQKRKNPTRATKYLVDIVQNNARNSKILGCMMDYCIEKKTMMDFFMRKVSLPTFLQYMALKRIQLGSHTIEKHRKYIAPYYLQIRNVFAELQRRDIILLAHPVFGTELSIPESEFQASTLLNLHGLKTYSGVPHFATSAVTAQIKEPALMGLLDVFFQGLVANAGHSGRLNLNLPDPKPLSEQPENAEDRATKDRKNKRRRDKTAQKNAEKEKAEKEKAENGKPTPKKRGRETPGVSPVRTSRKKKKRQSETENPPTWFLEVNPACSAIMQHVGELSKENCWEKGLESLGVTVTEHLQRSCQSAHKMCIQICNASLPDEKRGVHKYEVYSRLSLTMNYRGANDEWHSIEAPHMDMEPTKVAQLSSQGIFAFTAIVPILKEGNYMRVHPSWKDKEPATEEGRLVYSPLGTIVVMPGTMVYGCGIRTGNGGNPCLKLHYFLTQKSTDENRPLTNTDSSVMSDYILKALKYCVASPDGTTQIPHHPTQKRANGDYTVYFMTREYLVYLIKKSKLERSKKKDSKEELAKLTVPSHRSAGSFYGPKILEDLYEVVGL